jgi:ribonucleoside-diphosphate reductase alpha chain
MRKNHGDEEMKARDLFYALWIPDLFMERVKTGGNWTLMCPDECPGLSDVYGDTFAELYTSYETAGKGRKTLPARELWFQILDAQMETGTPYLLYKDAANRKSNQKNIGVIKSSNLCVAPETLILTDKGHLPIGSLRDQRVNVWNGEEFSEVVVKKTGVQQPLIEIHTNDGASIACTPYHKFYVHNPKSPHDVVVREAQDLRLNDILLECSFPVIQEGERVPTEWCDGWCDGKAYTHGVACGDGTFTQDKVLLPFEYNLETRLEWFAGLCDAAANLNYDTNRSSTPYLQITTMCQGFLTKVKYLLQTCGVNARIQPIPPNTNDLVFSARKPIYRLWLYPTDVEKLVLAGFSPKRIDIQIPKSIAVRRPANSTIQVSKIIDNERFDDTYCFTEPKRNMGVFNGMLTGQCTEIMEVSTEAETAVCNLASIGLPMFVEGGRAEADVPDRTPTFDHAKLHDIARMVTYNLNCIIDVNYYPTEKTRLSNMRHRPIGIGVQGLADVFLLMNVSFTSDAAKQINREIFETIYHGALVESCALAKQHGAYETFAGSPASEGILQFDMWGVTPDSGRYDWDALKRDIQTHGLRNSLLLAPMPTASTSQILGYNECIEPITSNIYSRRTLAGEFIMANKYLMHDLMALDLWNEKIKNNIIANNGSVQQIEVIPPEIREKYRTVWEIPMRHLIDMSADRGAYICQSQSLNLWLEDPNYNSLTSMHFYSWNKGLKTGIYYLRRRGKHQAQQFTIEPEKKSNGGVVYEDDHEICEMCSS